MSTSIDDILAMISGGGDPSIELKDNASQLAIARALKNRNVSPVMASGSATLPNISGLLNNGRDRRTGGSDESRLMSERLAIQNADTKRAADQIQPSIAALSGANAIENVDNSPSTLTAGNDPAAVEQFNLLQGATAGAPAVEQQDTLRKFALQRAVARDRVNRVGGGKTTLLQLTDRNLQEHPDWSYDQAMNQAIADLETYSVHEVAGGIQRIGNRGGSGLTLPGGTPAAASPGGREVLSTLPTEADAAAKIAASKGEGTVAGTTEAERFYKQPKAKAAMEAAVANYRETIQKAKEVRDVPGLGRVTGLMALVPSIWGGQAKDKENAIETLKIGLGFDRLQAMRDASPTGGALGQVSEREGDWLQNSVRNLNLSNSKEQYIFNLNQIIERMQGFEERAKAAYEADFGKNAPSTVRPTILPPAPTVKRIKVDAQGNVIQ